MTEHSPQSFLRILRRLGKNIPYLIRNRFRALIVISGSNPEFMGRLLARAILYYERSYHKHARALKREKSVLHGLYVFHDEFPEAIYMKKVFEALMEDKARYTKIKYAVYEISERFLGATFDILIMDLTRDLKPNDLGRLIGIVRGGGLIILLTPKWSEWDNFMTIFKRNLTVPQFPSPRHIFIRWVKRKLMEHDNIAIYDADEQRILKNFNLLTEYIEDKRKIEYPRETLFPRSIYEQALTQDQIKVIKLLETLYEKPKKGKKKVIVITADRGRGKSCAVGIGAVGLILLLSKIKPRVRVLVTAPAPSNVQSLMMLAKQTLDRHGLRYKEIHREGYTIELRGDRFSIEYWEPISIPRLRGDIVIVDEAAGISVPMLYRIWESYDRLVFSTTIHGYEGAGRGFSVRFMSRVKSDPKTILYQYEMTEPIRYSGRDPIEKWQFDTLLLDAEPADLDQDDLRAIEEKRFKYIAYDPEYLFSHDGEGELRQLFGIYVLAHYRNEPDDLGMIADAPHHIIRTVKLPSGKIVCALQIAIEGPIERERAIELLKGGKIPGNIIPDRFLKHQRILEFADTRGWRIVRIATHPDVQGRGIGTWALSQVLKEAREKGLDWVGAGFGVNEQLLKFWVKSGFYTVHISPDRNPVSGEYTVLVIHPLSDRVKRIIDIAVQEFKIKLLNSLAINYDDLEIEVARLMLEQGKPAISVDNDPKRLFTPVQIDRIWIYCQGPMTFEAAADLMSKIARIYWLMPRDKRPRLTRVQEYILIGKALQGRSWDDMAHILRVKSKYVMEEARNIACIVLEQLFNISSNYIPGIGLDDYRVEHKGIL